MIELHSSQVSERNVLMVPKVNLLDVRHEPTDEELEALMLDFRRVVAIRRDAAHSAFLGNLATLIDEAARENLATDHPLASSNFGYAS